MGARSVQSCVPGKDAELSRARPGRVGRWALALAALVACDPAPRERGSARSHHSLAELTASTPAAAGPERAERTTRARPEGDAHAMVPAAVAPSTRRPGNAKTETPPPPRLGPFEMTFVGDVILGRYREDGFDPIPEGEHEMFGEVGPLMGSDLVVGNLETPLTRTLPEASPVGTQYSFGGDPTLARHLAFGGFDVMSLANNHAYDLRGEGVEQTPRILAELGITAVGAARSDGPRFAVETVERDGWRIAFLALTTRTNIPSLRDVPPLPLLEVTEIEREIAPLVQDARASHDLVVVLAHWGEEYADAPQWEQRAAAHALVEAGADLVIGHHPHVLQGIERHGHGLIAYSMGNFLFENVKDIPRMTGVLRVRYGEGGCLEDARVHPAFIKSIPLKYPAPATGYMNRQIKERLRSLSAGWGTRFSDDGDDLRIDGTDCPSADAR